MTTVRVRIVDGTLVESMVLFENPSGVATDPAQIVVQWQRPDETVETFTYGIDAEVVRTGTGAYLCQFLTDQAGGWLCEWEGVGLAVGSVSFRVQAQAIAGP